MIPGGIAALGAAIPAAAAGKGAKTAGEAALTGALLGGGALSGVGQGIGASMESDAREDAAREAALGPIRGGTERAGNRGQLSLAPSLGALEKIGQIAVPMRPPVYGSAGGPNMPPVDMSKLFQPRQFGTGFQAGNYNLNNVPRRF